MILSQTEENYLKTIYKLAESEAKAVNTNAIAAQMNTAAASVTDMLKRLSDKGLIHYEKYRGVTLSEQGGRLATNLVRKHRLWEVFLVEWLHFAWDEVHDLAEQLEHIQSDELIHRLDVFLNHPKFDPHGDPIPDADGNYTFRKQLLVSQLDVAEGGVVVGVNEHSPAFLQYLDRLGIAIGTRIDVEEVFEFDGSRKVVLNMEKEILLSGKVCENVFLKTLR
jgi:DtxR family transcriptional regulator, Mn-dependent transcriptional regulator